MIKWRETGIIEPIDTSRLENWDQVIPNFPVWKASMLTANSGLFRSTGVQPPSPRTDLVTANEAATLQSFADPKFASRVSLVDNVDDAYALGFLATGITDRNKATMDDLDKASAFLRKVHQNVRTYWQDGAEVHSLMTSGEIALSWSWNEVVILNPKVYRSP